MPTALFLRAQDVAGSGSGAVGAGWAGHSDTTAIWGTHDSGASKRWVDQLYGGSYNSLNPLLRTGGAEAFLNGKNRIRCFSGQVNNGLHARVIGTRATGSWWRAIITGSNMSIRGRVAGTDVFIQAVNSIPGLPTERLMEMSVSNTSSTQTTITIKVWDSTLVADMSVDTISVSPAYTYSVAFTTTSYAATLRASGAWGMGADNGVGYTQYYQKEDDVALSATASLGTVFRESFYATVSPTGGVSTNTITAHLSTTSGFTPSGANEISGVSGTTLSASGLTAGKIYYLKFKIVNGAETVITDQITVTTKPSNHYIVTALGDSLTDGTGSIGAEYAPVTRFASILTAAGYSITALEEGVFGDSTTSYLSGTLPGTITRAAFAKASHALAMLGTNDAAQSISTATSQANFISIINQLASGVPTLQGIMLNQQPYAFGIDVSGYIATHSAIIAGTTTTLDYLGNQTMFATSQSNYPGWYSDAAHLNNTGYVAMATLWAGTFSSLYSPTTGLSPLVLSATSLQVEAGGSRPLSVRVVSSIDGTGQAGLTVTVTGATAGVTITASAVTDADGYAYFRGSDAVVVPVGTAPGTTANLTFSYSTLTAVCAVEVVAAGGISGGGAGALIDGGLIR